MAALRSGVTPACLARCFLRHTGKQSRGSLFFSDTRGPRLLLRSNLHTVFEGRSPAARTLLGRRHNGKFLWVNVVRHNSSQIPPEDATIVVPDVLPASLPPDPAPIITQSIAEQIPVEVMSAPVVEISPPPPVLDPSPELLTADSATVLTEPVLDVSPEILSVDPAPVLTQPVLDPAPVLTQPILDPSPVLTQPILEQVSDVAPTAVEVLQAATTEPTLAELGLGAYTPVGLIQNLLEFMHVGLGLPWWGAIVVGTVAARLAMFPVIVKGQREAVKLNNVMPEMTRLTTKMTEAKNSGNQFEFAKAYTDLTTFQKKHDVNPLRGFIIPVVQAPIFISFFIALRKMAYLPVPSLQTGGLFWFTDLTAADPFFILPLAVTGTMFFILELGAESGVDNPNLRTMKTVFRIMPFIILPLTVNFPTAVFTYWLTSNTFSLGQVALLKHPLIRQKLKIAEKVKHPESSLPKKEGFIESLQKGYKNAQLAHQLEERERNIKNHLEIAARGPLRQTFAHNPLAQKSPTAAASTKSKSKQPWKDGVV